MLLEQLWREIPELEPVIRQQVLVSDREQTWLLLRQLMLAHAPSTGAGLPGGVIDQVSDIAAVFGLADRLVPNLAGSGCPGMWLGVAKDAADLLVVAPLDRLTFRPTRVIDDLTAELAPICVSRSLADIAQSPAKGLRFDPDRGRLAVAAQGQIVPFNEKLRFRAERGTVTWTDAITLDLVPQRQNDWVRGSGLDNAAGVLCALATASALRGVEEALLEHNRRCLFVFPDRRDVDLQSLLSRGWGSMQPGLGTVLIEGLTADQARGPRHEAGAGYAFSNGKACGLHVPLNYQQLTSDLDASFQNLLSDVAQFSVIGQDGLADGELVHSRRIMGLMGPPLGRPHAGQETVHLEDMAASVWWMSAFVTLVLNLVPSVTARYALGR